MKVGIRRSLIIISCALLQALLLTPLISRPAQAAGENYLFYINSKQDLNDIYKQLQNNVFSSSITGGLNNTSVYIKDGLFTKPFGPLILDTSTRASGGSGGSKIVSYTGTYYCNNGKATDGNKGDYAITVRVSTTVSLPPSGNLESKQLDGNITVDRVGLIQNTASKGSSNTEERDVTLVPPSCIPSNAKSGIKPIRLANYLELSTSQKSAWPSKLKTSTEGGVELNAAANADADKGGSDSKDVECSAPGGFGWIICGSIQFMSSLVDWIEKKVIEPFLDVKPLSFSNDPDTNPQYAAWNSIRTIANVFFVLIFLVLIFANTFSLEPYNVKKMLPKLVVAAVLVQFSFVFMAAAIDAANIFGKGLRSLLEAIMPAASIDANVGSSLLTIGAGALVGIAVTAKIASIGIWLSLMPLLLGMVAVLFTLVLRQTIIVLLILTAPVAFVAFVLPNTEKFFKSWLNLFIRVLLMYPLIILLFAAGKIAAFAAGTSGGALAPVIAILCLALPLLAVPFSFSFAGGIMGKVGGAVFKGSGKIQKGVMDNSKDYLESRKRNATLNADPTKSVGLFGTAKALKSGEFGVLNPVNRWRSKVAGGGFLWTSSGAKRRMGDAQEKIFSADEKALDRQVTAEAAGSRDTKESLLEQLAKGTAKGYHNDISSRRYAIKALASMRSFDKIRELRANGSLDQETFTDAINSSFGDIDKAAPDITRGNFGSLKSMTISDFGNLHESTLRLYAEGKDASGKSNLETGETLADRHANIRTMFDALDSNSNLKKNFNRRVIGTLKDLAANGKLGAHSSHIDGKTDWVPGAVPGTAKGASNDAFIK